MDFLDTPNPNAKKIELNHNFEISKYITEEEVKSVPEILTLLNINGIENIFTGPGFITVMKNTNSNWENIIKDFNNKLDKI
jgi:hypothetical protein